MEPERVTLGGQPSALQGAEDGVGVRLEQRVVAVGALADRAVGGGLRGREGGQPGEEPRQLPALPRAGLGRHAALGELDVAHAPGAPGERVAERRTHGDHDVVEPGELGRHLGRRARLEEHRAQADGRLGGADLLQHRQLEGAPHWDDAAVAH
jgi:hypothetical protein